MRVYCTYCSADKRPDADELPAIERYVDDRIDAVAARAERDARGLVILSGRFGLILGDTPIPYYDHLLTDVEVEQMTTTVAEQLTKLEVTEATYFTVQETVDPKVRPYRAVFERACARVGVPLTVEIV